MKFCGVKVNDRWTEGLFNYIKFAHPEHVLFAVSKYEELFETSVAIHRTPSTVDVFSTEQSWHPTWLWPWWALILVLLAAFVWIVWTYRACRENAALRGRHRVLWLVLATLRFTLFGLLIFFSL